MGEKRSEQKCRVGGGVRSKGEVDGEGNEDKIGDGSGDFLEFSGFQMSSEGEWYHATGDKSEEVGEEKDEVG